MSSKLFNGTPFLNGSTLLDTSHSDIDTNISVSKLPHPTSYVQSPSPNASSHSYELRSRSHNSPNQLGSPQTQLSTGALRGAIEPLLSNGDAPRRRGRPRSPRSSSPASQTPRGSRRQQHSPGTTGAANGSAGADPYSSSCSSSSASLSDQPNGTCSTHPPPVSSSQAGEQSAAASTGKKHRSRSEGRWAYVLHKARSVLDSQGGGFGLLFFVFACYLLALVGVYLVFPEMRSDERKVLHLPTSLEDARALGIVLRRYSDRYLFTVTTGFTLTYIFLQSFAIPGSIFLSIVSGFLFSFPKALFLVCFCSAVGASNCYLLSHLTGRRLVRYYFPKKLAEYSLLVNSHRDHLLWYVIFLRVTPIIPNWVINIISPVVDMPMWIFFVATFIGVAPPSCIAIESGQTLNELAHAEGAGVGFTWAKALFIAFTAALSLLPILLQRLFAKRLGVVRDASAGASAQTATPIPTASIKQPEVVPASTS